MNFPQILRFPIRKRFVGPQDDLQNASRSAQDGSKTVLKSVFLDVKNNLNFCLVSGLVFHGFGEAIRHPKIVELLPFFVLEIDLLFECRFGLSRSAQEAPKRPQELPKTPPGSSKRRPRPPQECPRGSQSV